MAGCLSAWLHIDPASERRRMRRVRVRGRVRGRGQGQGLVSKQSWAASRGLNPASEASPGECRDKLERLPRAEIVSPRSPPPGTADAHDADAGLAPADTVAGPISPASGHAPQKLAGQEEHFRALDRGDVPDTASLAIQGAIPIDEREMRRSSSHRVGRLQRE